MFKKRQLKEEYLKFLGEYTSIDTVGFNFKSSVKGKFCGLFDCETYFDYAIAFDDKIKPNEFDQIFQLLVERLGEPDLFSDYEGYVWKKKRHIVTFGFVSLNYNYDLPMISIRGGTSILNSYVPYKKYSQIADIISKSFLEIGVNIQLFTYYKINYWREFGYVATCRLKKGEAHVSYKKNKLSLLIIPRVKLTENSEKLITKDRFQKELIVSSACELKDALSGLIEEVKQNYGEDLI